ncbi:hypothetical protein HBI38_182060 [Parastagonospora nodorum]|nr:hypothetical protein HBI09_188050 [Parastagonospora nodorum]KAH4183514.1 hypothetical protein HBH42_205620 [Parastagonospora nodorum]KAH4606417.1 hypothetical protein HBH82_109990 [Parastagonospora nodorum]KAH4665912.1 hypothetical protein HBH78_201550 [Parastagonospora nodorum]KAH4697313.1 hypothetical protein HBH67_183080 [Parastagonospora nodorum]
MNCGPQGIVIAPTTYRTATGFGDATNGAILWQLHDLLLPFGDRYLDAYVKFILAPKSFYIHESFDQASTRAAFWPWRNLADPGVPLTPIVPQLSRLPDELLLQISINMNSESRKKDLSSLSLTFRRLRGVAQETLSWSAVVYPHNVREHFDRLVRNPLKMLKLDSISFEEAHCVRNGSGCFAQEDFQSGWLQYGSHPSYSETLTEIRLDSRLKSIVQGFGCDVSSIKRSRDPAASTIFGFSPNLTELVVADSFIDANEVAMMFEGDQDFSDVELWPWPPLVRMQTQICRLVVKQRYPSPTCLNPSHAAKLWFDGFRNLVELSVTAPLLNFDHPASFCPYTEVIDLRVDGTGLPNGLKALRIFIALRDFGDLTVWLRRFLTCVPASGFGLREYWQGWGFGIQLLISATYNGFMKWLFESYGDTHQEFLKLLEDPGQDVITTYFLRLQIIGGVTSTVASQDRADFLEQMIR